MRIQLRWVTLLLVYLGCFLITTQLTASETDGQSISDLLDAQMAADRYPQGVHTASEWTELENKYRAIVQYLKELNELNQKVVEASEYEELKRLADRLDLIVRGVIHTAARNGMNYELLSAVDAGIAKLQYMVNNKMELAKNGTLRYRQEIATLVSRAKEENTLSGFEKIAADSLALRQRLNKDITLNPTNQGKKLYTFLDQFDAELNRVIMARKGELTGANPAAAGSAGNARN